MFASAESFFHSVSSSERMIKFNQALVKAGKSAYYLISVVLFFLKLSQTGNVLEVLGRRYKLRRMEVIN